MDRSIIYLICTYYMYYPNSNLHYNIYDVLHNDDNKVVIVMPSEYDSLDIKYIDNNSYIDFNLYKCPHKHVYIYVLTKPTNYSNIIKLKINGQVVSTCVSKYPEFKNEIIMSTIVKNEDKYIIQWIEFYSNLGIQRFIIYDNSDELTLDKVLKSYIDENKVVLIKWNYPYRLPVSGFSGQQSQQNHSIYAFQNCKYIGLFDVDEYLNLQKHKNINEFLDYLIDLKKINIKETGSFKFWSKEFYNPNNLPCDNYNFLKIFECSNVITNGHEKNFVIPKNVQTFSVHVITKGKFMNTITPDLAYFNHYLYLNKTNRGRNKSTLTDNTILNHVTNSMK